MADKNLPQQKPKKQQSQQPPKKPDLFDSIIHLKPYSDDVEERAK